MRINGEVLVAGVLGVGSLSIGPAFAQDTAWGNKTWGLPGVDAIQARCPTPNSTAWGWDSLRHALIANVNGPGGTPRVEVGYYTNVWGRQYYYAFTSTSGSETFIGEWSPGSTGVQHTFSIIWDSGYNSNDVWVDGTSWGTGSPYHPYYTSQVGVQGLPGSGQTSSTAVAWDSLSYATLSEWWWHGGWPASTNVVRWLDYNGGVGLTADPSESGFTSVRVWDN